MSHAAQYFAETGRIAPGIDCETVDRMAEGL